MTCRMKREREKERKRERREREKERKREREKERKKDKGSYVQFPYKIAFNGVSERKRERKIVSPLVFRAFHEKAHVRDARALDA